MELAGALAREIDPYHDDGFAVLRGLFPSARIDAVLADVEAVFRRLLGPGAPPAGDEAALHDALVAFARAEPTRYLAAQATAAQLLSVGALATDDALLAWLRAVGLDAPFTPTPPIAYFLTEALAIPGDYHLAPPHQDWRYIQSSLSALTLWVPLVPVDAAMGVVEMLPGSHRDGLRPTGSSRHDLRIDGLDDAPWIAPRLAPGDALCFSCLTVHRSGRNTSGRMRWAVALRFADAAEPAFVARGYPNPYRFQPTLEILTPGFPTAADVAAALARRGGR